MGFLTLQVVSTDAAVCVGGVGSGEDWGEVTSFPSGNNDHFDFIKLPLAP